MITDYPERPRLVGRSVVLRPPEEGDVEARLRLGRTPEIARLFGADVDKLSPLTAEKAQDWIERVGRNPNAWIIEHGRLIGDVRLTILDAENRWASLAIGIVDPTALEHGLGTQALRLVLTHGFATLNLHRVSARVLALNERAIHVYKKIGFVIEGRERETLYAQGRWHDDIIMGLLRWEFEPLTQ